MNQAYNRTDRKTTVAVKWIFVIIVAAFMIVVGRLAFLQLKNHDTYQAYVLNQLTKQQEVTPTRGLITDRNGEILATNKTVYDVILSPDDIKRRMDENEAANSDKDAKNDVHYHYTDEQFGIDYTGDDLDDMIADVLSKYLVMEKSKIYEKAVRHKENGQYYMYSLIKNNVESDIADRINLFIAQFDLKKQIYFVAGSKRYYPYGDLACHVIGFTNSNGVGIYGIEAYYNNVLEGTSGKYILAQDARNNDMPFEYERFIDAQDGNTIRLTIDIYIQKELENQLEKTFYESGADNRVCGIVMDSDTAEVLAMATYPSFDLNDPYTLDEWSQSKLDANELSYDSVQFLVKYLKSSGFSADKIEDLTGDIQGKKLTPKANKEDDDGAYEYLKRAYQYQMWNNKCTTETYEPGSTFKVITTAMAFEENVIDEKTPFSCYGSYTVPGWSHPIACANSHGHGKDFPFEYGLQQSCNPTLMQVAERIGRERFYYYFGAFGYKEKTGIDLPGEIGSIYNSYEDFNNVSLAVYSFGQTFKVTPIQQLRALTAVANGGTLLTPHLMKDILDGDGNVIQSYEADEIREVVSENTCSRIAKILEEGVRTDGAAKNAYVKGFRVAAKTGTSEKRDEYDEFGNRPYRVGSTAAFAPSDDSKVSALIMVDKPLGGPVYGGTVAAPYISNLLNTILPYVGVEPEYTADELAGLDETVSYYIGSTVKSVKDSLQWSSFGYEIVGNGDVVTAQVPAAGAKISKDSGILLLYTENTEPAKDVVVPDFLQMNAYNANNIGVAHGLNLNFVGAINGSTATVIGQSIPAGTSVPRGTVVEIELRHLDGLD